MEECSLHNFCSPSAIISEAFAHHSAGRSVACEVMEELGKEGFFTSCETLPFPEVSDRRRSRLIADKYDFTVTHWLIPDLKQRSLNLSDTDVEARSDAISFVLSWLPPIAESGARYVGLWSGGDPGPEDRESAIRAFEDSIMRVSKAAMEYGLGILIEPFDRSAHKKGLIGPAEELAEFLGRLPEGHAVTACWDVGHMVLGGDDLFGSLEAMLPQISHVHLSNCILNPSDDNFGDWHMRPGEPGFLTPETISRILSKLESEHTAGRLGDFSLAYEFRPPETMDPWQAIESCRHWLTEAID